MKYPKEVQCPDCKEVRLVDGRNYYRIKTGRCYRCSRPKKGQRNKGCFKKGSVPWNKGKKGVMPTPWNKGLKGFAHMEQNGMWKGEEAGYFAKHIWVVNNYGNPKKCEHCGTEEDRMYHWANISLEYKRGREDWLRLCVPCHSRFDRERHPEHFTRK